MRPGRAAALAALLALSLPAALAPLLALAPPAAAQRPRCGFGAALAALGTAERTMARPVEGLSAGRAQAGAAAAALGEAMAGLQGCGCRRAAEDAADAALLAEAATAEASAPAVAARLDRAGFSVRLARERLGREGCA